ESSRARYDGMRRITTGSSGRQGSRFVAASARTCARPLSPTTQQTKYGLPRHYPTLLRQARNTCQPLVLRNNATSEDRPWFLGGTCPVRRGHDEGRVPS